MAKGSKEVVERLLICDGDYCVVHDGTFYNLCEHRPHQAGTHREWRPLPFNARTLQALYDRISHYFGRTARYIVQDIDAQLRTQELLLRVAPHAIRSDEDKPASTPELPS